MPVGRDVEVAETVDGLRLVAQVRVVEQVEQIGE